MTVIFTKFPTLFAQMRQAMRPANYDDAKTPKARNTDEKSKTRKGATHVVNPTFHSRQIFSVTPAQFRRLHMGRTSKRWEKKNGS